MLGGGVNYQVVSVFVVMSLMYLKQKFDTHYHLGHGCHMSSFCLWSCWCSLLWEILVWWCLLFSHLMCFLFNLQWFQWCLVTCVCFGGMIGIFLLGLVMVSWIFIVVCIGMLWLSGSGDWLCVGLLFLSFWVAVVFRIPIRRCSIFEMSLLLSIK